MNRPIYFSDSIIRFALGDPALVGRLLTSVRNADDAMQKGDVEELERWARMVEILRQRLTKLTPPKHV